MANIDEMRLFVSSMYPTDRWRRKVQHMPDGQVFAIFKREGQSREKAEAEARAAKRRAARNPAVQQNTQDDIPF